MLPRQKFELPTLQIQQDPLPPAIRCTHNFLRLRPSWKLDASLEKEQTWLSRRNSLLPNKGPKKFFPLSNVKRPLQSLLFNRICYLLPVNPTLRKGPPKDWHALDRLRIVDIPLPQPQSCTVPPKVVLKQQPWHRVLFNAASPFFLSLKGNRLHPRLSLSETPLEWSQPPLEGTSPFLLLTAASSIRIRSRVPLAPRIMVQ